GVFGVGPLDQLRLNDEPLSGREVWVACRERQPRPRLLLGDPDVVRFDDVDLADFEDVLSDRRLHVDLVSDLELIEVVERPPIGGSVARDHGVSWLARHRGPGHVTRAFLQRVAVDSLENDLVYPDLFDRHPTESLSLGHA